MLKQLDFFIEEKGWNKSQAEKLKAFFLTGNEKGIEELIIENLKNEKSKVEKKEFKEIDTLLSFISLSEQKMEAFEKTIFIFGKRIKKMILLFTEKSKWKIEAIKKKYPKIEIKDYLIKDPENFIAIHYQIVNLLEKNEPISEKIIMDTTLGFKMISLALYRVSVELNIKSLNWKQEQLSVKGKNGYNIIPGSDTLSIISKPKMENYKLYRDINSLLDKQNYEGVSFLYNRINNVEKIKFYEFLSKIFNLFDYDKFKTNISKDIDNILNIDFSYEEKVKFNRLLLILKNILLGENERTDIKILEEKNNWGSLIIDNTKDLGFSEKQKYFFWRYLLVSIIEKKYPKKVLKLIMDDIILEDIKLYPDFLDYSSKITDEEIIKEYLDFCITVIFVDMIIIQKDEIFMMDKIEKHFFDKLFDFKEELSQKIIFQNGYLNILKFDIKIKETEFMIKGGLNKEFIKENLFIDLIDNRKVLSKEELKQKYTDYYKNIRGEYNKNTIEKNVSRIWSIYILEMNQKIKNIIKKEYQSVFTKIKDKSDFFEIKEKGLFINKIFY